MRYVKNSKGYTMLIAIVAIVLFSVLGISLMTLTSNGLAKNESRVATVQAKDLSDKGVDFAVNSVQTKLLDSLKDATGKFALTKSEFERKLIETLSAPNLQCPNPLPDVHNANFGIKIDGNIDGTKTLVCIDKVEELEVDPANPEKNKYKRNVTFKSYGISNGKYEITTAKITVGTDAIPDQLKYAVSSNNGSIYFHGGVEVTGDIKTANNIYIAKKAFMSDLSSPRWYDSVPLKINKTTGNATAKLIFNNNDGTVNYYTSTNKFNNGTKLNYSSPDKTLNTSNPDEIRSLLTNSPNTQVITKTTQSDSVKVGNEVLNMKLPTKRVKGNLITDASVFDQTENNITLVYDNCTYKQEWQWGKGWVWVKDTCKDSIFNKTSVKLKKNYSSSSNKNDQNNELILQGTYYINGDFEILNANVKSNAILYVDGNVTIKESTLESHNGGTLIIFASGNIKISNISEYSSTPSEIRGFFYSESDMTLYGVGSNIKIVGGISATNLYLTSLRGNSNAAPKDVTINSDKYYNHRFTIDINHQLTNPSRLQIIYDENIINQYTKFKRDQEEEFITVINDPQILERY